MDQERSGGETAEGALNEGMQHLRDGRIADAERSFRAGLAIRPNDPGLLKGLAAVLTRQGRVKETITCLVALSKHDPRPDEVGDALEPYLDRYVNPGAIWGVLVTIAIVLIGAAVLSALGYTGISTAGSQEISPVWVIASLATAVFGVCVVVLLIARYRVRDAFDDDIRRRYEAMGSRTVQAFQQGAKEPQRQLAVLFSLFGYWRARR
jgi:hypothetical protein